MFTIIILLLGIKSLVAFKHRFHQSVRLFPRTSGETAECGLLAL